MKKTETQVPQLTQDETKFIFDKISSLDDCLEEIIRKKLPARTILTTLSSWFLEEGFDGISWDLDYLFKNLACTKGQTQDTPIKIALSVHGHHLGKVQLFAKSLTTTYSTEFVAFLSLQLMETIDNVLYLKKLSFVKDHILEKISKEYVSPVLEKGVTLIIDFLNQLIPCDSLYLIFEDQALSQKVDMQYLGFIEHKMVYCRNNINHPALEKILQQEDNNCILNLDNQRYNELFKCKKTVTKKIISIVNGKHLGTLVLCLKDKALNPFLKDILEILVEGLHDVLTMHVREKKRLTRHFSLSCATKMLTDESYVEKYLEPQLRNCGILFVDVSGFTMLSEQILKHPKSIANFVEAWSKKAIDILYSYNGVYDKLVGDCVIGIFGPPFFELSDKEVKEKTLQCAIDIAKMTLEYNEDPVIKDYIRTYNIDFKVSVSTGINFAPLFVGQLGPDKSYTGLSQGMNNTARLQGLAASNEVLFMKSMSNDLLDSLSSYDVSQTRYTLVKNVKEPLEYQGIII
ncbi:MAG: adenylate/guanylate cyclase domain-containing protein [Candidatus Cloacimonetes bacterium]|nr:adenylate/guanylate cyclase domain-containing protein [Candidatus Cloacimonadota bacterium]